jgi:hypothetical protein
MHVSIKKNSKMFIKTDGRNVYKIIEYESGESVQIPINKDGSVKWFDDEKLLKKTSNIR